MRQQMPQENALGLVSRAMTVVLILALSTAAQAKRTFRLEHFPQPRPTVAGTKGDRLDMASTGTDGELASGNETAETPPQAGADLAPAQTTDLNLINPATLAPGIQIPSLQKAFEQARKHQPRDCRADIQRLAKKTVAPPRLKHSLNDFIRAGQKVGISEDQMRQTLSVYLSNRRAIPNQKYLAIIDYSKTSREKRLFMVDIMSLEIKAYHVAHGKGSDPNGSGRAKRFGNESGSKRSSLGCMIAGGTYNGTNGLSLRLHGIEGNTNSNACARSVVMHGADYVGGSPGRSWGCPAVKQSDRKKIFAQIGDGGLVCSFAKDRRG